MLVSVVISGFNAEKFIEKCVNDYVNQTYANIEIILFDDASTDNTREQMLRLQRKYPTKIKVAWTDQNLGPGGGKDRGCASAVGDYIAFGDCDDPVDRDYILELVKTANKNNCPDIVIGGFKKITEDGKVLYTRLYNGQQQALFRAISNWGKLYKRSFLKKYDLHIPAGRLLDDVLFQSFVNVRHPTVAVCEHANYFYLTNMQSVSHTYLNHFKEGVIEQEISALYKYYMQLSQTSDKQLFVYYIVRCLCWHLLKSGCGVPIAEMKSEYKKAFSFLEEKIPEFKHCPYISFFKPKYERKVVRYIVAITVLLHRMHLSWPFFAVYSKAKFLKKFWPNM